MSVDQHLNDLRHYSDAQFDLQQTVSSTWLNWVASMVDIHWIFALKAFKLAYLKWLLRFRRTICAGMKCFSVYWASEVQCIILLKSLSTSVLTHTHTHTYCSQQVHTQTSRNAYLWTPGRKAELMSSETRRKLTEFRYQIHFRTNKDTA